MKPPYLTVNPDIGGVTPPHACSLLPDGGGDVAPAIRSDSPPPPKGDFPLFFLRVRSFFSPHFQFPRPSPNSGSAFPPPYPISNMAVIWFAFPGVSFKLFSSPLALSTLRYSPSVVFTAVTKCLQPFCPTLVNGPLSDFSIEVAVRFLLSYSFCFESPLFSFFSIQTGSLPGLRSEFVLRRRFLSCYL